MTAYVPHNFPHDELEPGLDETAFYDPKNFTFPSGAHIAEVEIDLETGQVAIVNFTASDDFGRIINPPNIIVGQLVIRRGHEKGPLYDANDSTGFACRFGISPGLFGELVGSAGGCRLLLQPAEEREFA